MLKHEHVAQYLLAESTSLSENHRYSVLSAQMSIGKVHKMPVRH